MTHAYTIILPHKRNKGNDEALKIAIEMLMQNSAYDFHLLVDAAVDSPLYPRINAMVQSCPTECFVYWSSDMFPAVGWDVWMLAAWKSDPEHLAVTNVVVEPRMIGMHPENLERDFGHTPETFRREAFEQWAATEGIVPDGVGWLTPYMMSRTQFLAAGGMSTASIGTDDDGFSSADTLFFEQWVARGNKIQRARSFVYHLQRWSEEREQNHEKRKS